MRRRTFLVHLAAASAFPAPALAQSPSGARRLGVLTMNAENDVLYKHRMAALTDGLTALGWKEGANLSIEWRFCGGDRALLPSYADELVAHGQDALLAVSTPSVAELQRRTRTIPIVFTVVTDPIGQGFVASLSRPGGNITGFTDFDLSMGGKWLEMLTEISPPVATIGILYNPATAPFADGIIRAIGETASSRGVTARAAPASDEAGIEAAAATLSRQTRAAMLVLPDVFAVTKSATVIRAAARLRLPTLYPYRRFVGEGGLMSYGSDPSDLHRRSAGYIDRIFKGADPAELPVQNPIKFELVINLNTAKALGVEIPPTLLAAADEVIE
jgi:putative ABC transport system substrate-binding protein